MKYVITFVALILLIHGVDAATPDSTSKKMPSLERRALLHRQFLARKLIKEGGMVSRTDPLRKHILFLNSQRQVPEVNIRNIAGEIGNRFSIETAFSNSTEKTSLFMMDSVMKDWHVGAVVAIVDEPSWPILLVAPEARWVMVNVHPLLADGGKDKLTNRITKVMWRGFAYVGGAAHTIQGNCVMRPVENLSDIDHLKASTISPAPEMGIREHLTAIGVRPIVKMSYKNACEQGWAPAPTNDIQKAIWDKVHAMPTAPIKIKPETKKVRE